MKSDYSTVRLPYLDKKLIPQIVPHNFGKFVDIDCFYTSEIGKWKSVELATLPRWHKGLIGRETHNAGL